MRIFIASGRKPEQRKVVLEPSNDHSVIVKAGLRALFAVRDIEPGKYLVVVYRELQSDGFIITAFITRRIESFRRRQQLWPS